MTRASGRRLISSANWPPPAPTGWDATSPGWNNSVLAPTNLQITFELKNGDKDTVDFGGEFRQRQTGLGAVTLDGDRWVFLFSPVAYQLALSYLTIPANVP